MAATQTTPQGYQWIRDAKLKKYYADISKKSANLDDMLLMMYGGSR